LLESIAHRYDFFVVELVEEGVGAFEEIGVVGAREGREPRVSAVATLS
jgi:hypothetical protein